MDSLRHNLFDLTNEVAIVTGGNGGLGKGMALGLALAGAQIVIAARDDRKSTEAAAEIESMGGTVLAIRTDVVI